MRGLPSACFMRDSYISNDQRDREAREAGRVVVWVVETMSRTVLSSRNFSSGLGAEPP